MRKKIIVIAKRISAIANMISSDGAVCGKRIKKTAMRIVKKMLVTNAISCQDLKSYISAPFYQISEKYMGHHRL
jgi:hypothetical protein